MASPLAASPEPAPAAQPCATHVPAPFGPPMTRCECAGVAFAEVARWMESEGLHPEQAIARTRCGQTCGACIPDLRRFLAAR
jgi:NAD(P)H-nitrite reductase large subunit